MTVRSSACSILSRSQIYSNRRTLKLKWSDSLLRRENTLLCSFASSSSHQDEQQRNQALDYLQSWVGKKSTQKPSVSRVSNSVENKNGTGTNNPMAAGRTSHISITNTTYLLPTLRLERSDSPESLASQLERIFASLTTRTPNRSLSILLQQCNTNYDTNNNNNDKASWRAPVILDLQAFMPDGSPHYQAPPHGTLGKYKQILANYGLALVGVSNCPKNLEQECVKQEALPIVWSVAGKRPNINDTSNDPRQQTFSIQDVIQLVLSKQSEEGEEVEEESCSTKEKKSYTDKTLTHEEQSKDQDNFLIDSSDQNYTITESPKLTKIENPDIVENENDQSTPHQQKKDLSTKKEIIPPPNCKVYNGSIRSGQQVSTDEPYQSLIVIGNVNSGGECLADGDIYIFGKLRGRALAGLAKVSNPHENNDQSTDTVISPGEVNTVKPPTNRIFASSFDPELICIGDNFTTIDSVQDCGLEKGGGAAMVSMNPDTGILEFENIQL